MGLATEAGEGGGARLRAQRCWPPRGWYSKTADRLSPLTERASVIRPCLFPSAVVLALVFGAGAACGQGAGAGPDGALARLVAEQDALALQDRDDFYSYYELGTFDVAGFDQAAALAALAAELRDNRALDCSFAPYRPGEPSRQGILSLLTGAGQSIEAQRIGELPAERLVGAVMRSWEGIPGDVSDCNVSLARLYFDDGQVLTAYYDGREDLAATRPNVPSVVRLAPLEEFGRDRTRNRPAAAGGD